jgi:hypothetical protein
MPKVAAKTKDVVQKYVRKFSSETVKGDDGGVLYCVCCDTPVSTTTRLLVMQHINTAKQKENKERSQGFSKLLLHKLPQVLCQASPVLILIYAGL